MRTILEQHHNGYGPSNGRLEARKAIASYFSTSSAPISENDVFMTSGCIHALQLAIEISRISIL